MTLVIGYDDMSFAAGRMVELSTVRQPRHRIGGQAVRLLVERIEDPSRAPRQQILPHELVVRRTCGSRLRRRHGLPVRHPRR